MNEPLLPTLETNRIMTIDIIRGFALFGILLVNMDFFHSPMLFLVGSDVRLFHEPMDVFVNYLIVTVATGNFFTIFSFLFGLGFYIFMSRVEEKGLSVTKLYTRRLLFLFMIGVIHSVFLWSGDILLPYAIGGFFLLLFRNMQAHKVKKWAIGLFLSVNGIIFFITFLSDMTIKLLGDELQSNYFEEIITKSLFVYQNGSFESILSFRLEEEVPLIMFNLFISVPLVLSLFLFGLYVGKKAIVANIPLHINWLKGVCKTSFIVMLAVTPIFLLLKTDFIIVPYYFHTAVVDLLGNVKGLAWCFFYMSGLTLLCQKRSRLTFFGPVGKMALTNYLLQTIVCLLLFNGYGFGYYGKITPTIGLIMTIVIFSLQVIVSHIWLSYYRYGPIEWVWRRFTYEKRPQMKWKKK